MLDRARHDDDETPPGGQSRVPVDFQEHLANLEAAGLVVRIDREVNKDTELHPLVRWQFQGGLDEDERRAFLFTNVVGADGRRFDMPVVVGALSASAQIYALGMGCAVEDIGRAWTTPLPIRCRRSRSWCGALPGGGDHRRRPARSRQRAGAAAGAGFDAGLRCRALSHRDVVHHRDPETGVRNMGTYRAQLKATDRLGVRMASRIGGAGGYLHWQKYRARKQPMPCAIVVGCAPVVAFTGPQKLAIDLDEMGVAGALAGTPVRTVRAVTIDLDVPADAEIVIEGLIDPELLEPEGPFGESHGYIALEDFNMSMQVTAITHKRAPVFVSIMSQVTPSESSVIKRVAYEPVFLAHLRDSLSIKGIRRVVLHEPLSNIRPVIFLQFAPGTPQSEVWRGLNGAATLKADCGKIVIAVGEDIDPRNADAVFWSLAYRSNLADDLHVMPHRSVGHGPKTGRRGGKATLLIDATQKSPMPPLALPARPYMEQARTMWEELGLPALKPQPPWHGYSLGEWDAAWDRYAERAIHGRWAESGSETFARRRGGLTPETPVREVEGKARKGGA